MHFGFHVPTQLSFGAGTFQRAGEITASLGKRVFVVTGRAAMDRLGPSERLMNDLNQHSLSVRRFGGLESSPTTADVDLGAAEARDHRADVVVALGGGSVIDCAKAIAGVAASEATGRRFSLWTGGGRFKGVAIGLYSYDRWNRKRAESVGHCSRPRDMFQRWHSK